VRGGRWVVVSVGNTYSIGHDPQACLVVIEPCQAQAKWRGGRLTDALRLLEKDGKVLVEVRDREYQGRTLKEHWLTLAGGGS
jgi:hypothetical protein